MFRFVVVSMALCLVALPASASMVSADIDFTSGSVERAGGVKNYFEDDFIFFDARIVGGPCAVSGTDKCAALNKHEVTRLEHKDGLAFNLSSIWFYLNGKAEDKTNSLKIYDFLNPANFVVLDQTSYAHNVGHVVPLSFTGVTALIFESGGGFLRDAKGKVLKDQGNARFDSLKLSYNVPDEPPAVPLPASFPLVLTALGALHLLRRRAR